jgi:hypothetical protein
MATKPRAERARRTKRVRFIAIIMFITKASKKPDSARIVETGD